MSIKAIIGDWPNIPLTKDEARLLVKVERNPVYRDVVITYRDRNEHDSNPPEPYTFGDICYWLDYEANYQKYEENDGRFSEQAIASINKWIRTYSTYPIRPFGKNRWRWNDNEDQSDKADHGPGNLPGPGPHEGVQKGGIQKGGPGDGNHRAHR